MNSEFHKLMECSSLWSVAWYHDRQLIRAYKQASVWARLAEKCVYLSYRAPLSHSFASLAVLLRIFTSSVWDLGLLRPSVMTGPWWHRWSSLCSQLSSAVFLPPQKSAPIASCLALKVTHVRHFRRGRARWFARGMFRGHRCLPGLQPMQTSPPWARVCCGTN